MTSHILSIGQCTYDDSRIARVLQIEADAHLDRAPTAQAALQKIAENPYNLILINRILDADGSSGIDLIPRLKTTPNTPPIMLVSDLQDAQAAAVANGATPGFGKSSLGSPELAQLLRQTLGSGASARPTKQ